MVDGSNKVVSIDPSKRSSHLFLSLIPMNIVPADVLLEIADYLSCPSEILHLYLTVRANNSTNANCELNDPLFVVFLLVFKDS